MMPWSFSIVRRPNTAGTSLCPALSPMYMRLHSSETPIGTVALVLTALDEPPTPQTLLRPG
eukprot:10216455-Prorocentrum_lima.AAC.1